MKDLAPQPSNDNPRARQRQRNRAVFLALLGFAALIFAVTIVKIKMGFGE